MPDINTLPPSGSPTTTSRTQNTTNPPSPRPRYPHHDQQQQTASHSPTMHHRSSPRLAFQRHTSSRLGSFSLSDSAALTSASNSPTMSSAVPATADPNHHTRQPSLGELHQALENEQEATVNRLLAQIRDQRAQIELLQHSNASASTSEPTSTTLPPDTAPTPTATTAPQQTRPSRTPSTSRSRPPSTQPFPHPSYPDVHVRTYNPPNPRPISTSLSRHSSHRSTSNAASYPASPSLTPFNVTGSDGHNRSSDRENDEVTYTQSEAASVARENQLLKGRIRELERLVEEARVVRAAAAGADG